MIEVEDGSGGTRLRIYAIYSGSTFLCIRKYPSLNSYILRMNLQSLIPKSCQK